MSFRGVVLSFEIFVSVYAIFNRCNNERSTLNALLFFVLQNVCPSIQYGKIRLFMTRRGGPDVVNSICKVCGHCAWIAQLVGFSSTLLLSCVSFFSYAWRNGALSADLTICASARLTFHTFLSYISADFTHSYRYTSLSFLNYQTVIQYLQKRVKLRASSFLQRHLGFKQHLRSVEMCTGGIPKHLYQMVEIFYLPLHATLYIEINLTPFIRCLLGEIHRYVSSGTIKKTSPANHTSSR